MICIFMGLFFFMVLDCVYLCELYLVECVFYDFFLEDCIVCDCVGVVVCLVILEFKIDRKVIEKLIM